MDTFMSEAIIVEALLGSVLLALWMTWLVLRGLFWLMPVRKPSSQPVRVPAVRQFVSRHRNAA
jgi:hypothetical protein